MPKIVDHQQRYEELGRLAAIAVAEHGHEKLTLAEIAKRAGCSIGAISHYAKTKDEILLMACNFIIDDLLRRLALTREKYTGLSAVRQGLYEYLPCSSPYSRMIDNVVFCLWSKTIDNAEIRDALQACAKTTRDYFFETISEAQSRGELPLHLDASKCAQQMLACVDALTISIRVSGVRPSMKEQFDYADEWIEYLVSKPVPRIFAA